MNEEIKSRILMEMGEVLSFEEIQKLKGCLERNFYGVTINKNSTEVATIEKTTNEQMLKRFEFERGLEGISQNSLVQYIREVRRFFDLIGKHYSEVDSEDIQYYLYRLMELGSMTATSVDNARKFLKPFFKWLYENEFIPKDIFIKIKPIKRIEKTKEYLTDDEIVAVRDCCKDDVRALALIDTLLSTGLRVSECANLKISDIGFVKEEINVYSTKTNTWRKVYLDSNAKMHLNDYLLNRADNNPYVFVNTRKTNGKVEKMRKESIEKLVQKYCRKAQINRHCSVHLFRKTMATRLYSHGMDISLVAQILGHASCKTTEKYYLSFMDRDIRYMYARCSS